MSAFAKTIFRSIRDSLGRFFAIIGIVALGCGFFAGLQMSGPRMRAEVDELYDGTNLYDLRIVSTLGFTSDDVDRVAQIEGVDGIMAAISCDVMARLGPEQLAVRMSSIDVQAAEQGTEQGANAILSEDGNYLNRVFLREGRWPEGANECVMTADKPITGTGVGSTIEVLYGTTDLDDLLRERTFTVVGTVSSSNYPYTGSFGSTTLGSGMIGEYVYVSPDAFDEDAPFTEMYLRVAGANAYQSGSDDYQAAVDVVAERIEAQKDDLAQARLDDVRADAQRELDDAREEYNEERDKAERELADAKQELDDARKKLEDGERELADGRRQYEEGVAELARGREEAQSKLADGERQLNSGAAELEHQAQKLQKGKQDLAKGKKDYEAGLKELLTQLGAKDLASARTSLEEQRKQATEGEQALNEAKQSAQQIVDGKAELEAQRTQLEQSRAQLNDGRDQLLGGLAAQGITVSTLDEAVTFLTQTIAQMEAASMPEEAIAPLRQTLAQAQELVAADEQLTQGEAQLAQAQAELDAGEQQLVAGLAEQGIESTDASSAITAIDARVAEVQAGVTQIDEGLAGVTKLEQAKATLDKSSKQLADGERQIAQGRARIASGRSELEAQRVEAYRQLDEGQAELDDAKRKLDDGAAELADGRRKYEDGLAEYEDGKHEADQKLADAQEQIDDAQKKIDDLEAPDIYVLDRSQSEGAVTYDSDSKRIDSIADVFPLMFFLVAALVSLTTMTRMVEDDRIQIGTYKALGYSTTRIASKYLTYAGLAGAIGATLGILVLSQLLPYIVTSSYGIIYTVPVHPFPMPIDLDIALMSGGLGVGVTLVATWAAVVASLRETPATLMLPRPPASGKRILLERVGPVWWRLSFSWKVTCRNMFRYKKRLLMTVFGISGCTALLLVGFGLHDAIWDIIDKQYGPIIHFDTTIGLDSDATEIDVANVIEYLEGTGDVSGIERIQQENMQAGTQATDAMRVQVVTPRDSRAFPTVVTMRERVSGSPIEFNDDAVVVTEKLALKYGLSVGDQIMVFDQDAIGNVKGEGYPLTIDGITENYVANLVYVGRHAWRSVDAATPVFSTIYATTTQDEAARQRMSEALHEREDVSTVVFSNETVDLYRNMLSVVDGVVWILIVSAGLLAFIVLYNLTNINIGERIREIASLKVLGFTRKEVHAYIFREIFFLAVLGDALGMVLGTYLATFVITTAEVDYVMFGRSIHVPSYAYSFVLTLVFTAIIVFLMRHKLDRVDMVESLKSVD